MTIAVRKSDQVADDLLRQIARGDLEPGHVLPTEAELAAHYHVNRSVVREANKRLEVHGLVQPVKRRGTVVLDPGGSLSPQVLRAMLVDAEGRLDPEVLADFIEIRAELDIMMYGLAAHRRTDADLAAMDAQIAHMRALIEDPAAYGHAVSVLAQQVAAASHNRLFLTLSRWHGAVYEELEPFFRPTRAVTGPHFQGCQMLVEAIRARQADIARRLVRGFHDWVRQVLLPQAAEEQA